MPKTKPSFLRLFAGGFAIGTAAIVAIHAAQAEDMPAAPAAHAAIAGR